jgi:hypothetical protein
MRASRRRLGKTVAGCRRRTLQFATRVLHAPRDDLLDFDAISVDYRSIFPLLLPMLSMGVPATSIIDISRFAIGVCFSI